MKVKGIKKRPNGSFRLIVEMGYETVIDKTTGQAKKQRKQKWVTFWPDENSDKSPQKQAEAKMAELLHSVDKGTYIEPSKTTLIEYLRLWVENSVKPNRRPETFRVYKSVIDNHIAKSHIAHIPLQKLRTSDLERVYAESTLAPASLNVYHAIVRRALRQAVRDGLLTVNPAVNVENRRRPKKTDRAQNAKKHCWTADEARAVLNAAKSVSPQMAAFVFLALDSGARKSELHGLTWADVDLDAGTVTIARQLDKAGVEPVFGPTKTDRARTIPLNAETIARLRAHKKAQAALKMKNRKTYCDFNLVFAREFEDLQTPDAQLGQPLKTLSEKRFARLVESAGVRRIKFHGVRHTVATLLLQAGKPVHVVAQRLGHADATMTLGVYAHVMPSAQQEAAEALGAILHG